MEVPRLDMHVGSQQVQELSRFSDELSNSSTIQRYLHSRPLTPITEDPKAWWRYILNHMRA